MVMKLIGKILLLPVWVILAITWLVVHVTVSLFSYFYGFWKLFFTLVTILAIAFGLIQNAVLFLGAIAVVFAILFMGAAVDVFLETARKMVGNILIYA